MREILFRGKHICNEEWYEGSLLVWPNGSCMIMQFGEFPFESKNVDVQPKTVGQFTGLTDRHGKRIFEGDILRGYGGFVEGAVEYGDFNCSCCEGVYGWYINGGDIRNIDEYEVCGNIHDNPELLEVSNA